MKILIVDDDSFMHTLIGDMIASMHKPSELYFALDGREGLETFVAVRPDVILLDWEMPVMKGDECLQRMLDHNPEARIVLMTADDKDLRSAVSMSRGAISFLPKPFSDKGLAKAISG